MTAAGMSISEIPRTHKNTETKNRVYCGAPFLFQRLRFFPCDSFKMAREIWEANHREEITRSNAWRRTGKMNERTDDILGRELENGLSEAFAS